ncbi:hypothetical protein [Halorarum halobium]|uniref:hypothetical protein n=1 Tax=Halorarum halobium TaxID=3075121 RepID=UPI0028A698D2|nr:hypothetical protein [Halobaculum sp. XH14]
MSNFDDVGEFVSENTELLGHVLACGNDEARASVLALVANFGESDLVDEMQDELEEIRSGMES